MRRIIKKSYSFTVTAYQVTGLALELARKPDGTIDLENFEPLCERAIRILKYIESELNDFRNENGSLI